jgi:DNA-binding winged helix-turn-helix (wHTH) protein
MTIRFSFGDFELDEARFELRQGGRAVPLQPKVLDLIIHLARNRDRVVTKDELLETVWKGTIVTEGSLSQAVSLARRALADTPEEQHTLRTVRSKGLQFVAEVRATASAERAHPALVPVARPSSPIIATMGETAEDRAAGAVADTPGPCLIAALHCEAPGLGGAAFWLDEIDEVEVGRGSERRSRRSDGSTRVLSIAIPGRLLSRKHARMTRTPHGWLLIDEGSRNGTFVGGQRIDKRPVVEGDVIDCGRTLFRFTNERRRVDSRRDPDVSAGGAILGGVTPPVLDLERDLQRIAASDVPVLLLGETGVGKTHVAEAVHRLSGRNQLVRFDVDPDPQHADDLTLLVENLDGAPLARLERVLDGSPGARVIATSRLDRKLLFERLPPALQTRLVAYACELPALRDRIGDIGVLVARLIGGAAEPLEIEIEAGRVLMQHAWPGNVRELGHRLKTARSLAHGGPIRLGHLFPES